MHLRILTLKLRSAELTNFGYLGVVHSETSESTATRMINNTLTTSKAGTSFGIENKIPSAEIGDSFTSIVDFLIYQYGYSSDIAKCYLKVLVDALTARLRLMVWYRDVRNKKDMIIFQRDTMDFKDAIGSLIIRIIQKKFIPDGEAGSHETRDFEWSLRR